MALTAKQHVGQGFIRVALTGSAVAPELVVADIAKDHVAAEAAVDAVAGVGSLERVVARSTVDDADPVVTAIGQRGDIQLVGTRRDELDLIVAVESRDPNLLDQRDEIRVAPLREERPVLAVADLQIDLHVARHVEPLADHDDVVLARAFDQQDVGRVVVQHVARFRVTEVAIERVAQFRVSRAHIQHEDVDRLAAIQSVRAVLTFEPIRVGTAPHHILAAATIQLVFAAAAECRIRTAVDRGTRIRRVVRPGEIVAQNRVVAIAADQNVSTEVAIQPIAAAAAVEYVTVQ